MIEPCSAEATGVGMSPVDVSASLAYTDNVIVGTATADASWAGDANHFGSIGSETFAITRKTVIATPTAGQSKVYGAADPAFAYTLSEAISVTGALSRVAGENVGNYSITLGTLASASTNHTIVLSATPVNFAITAWNASGSGFYAPVGVPNSYFVAAPGVPPIPNCQTTMWNTVKGGSTVPLKFNVFAGAIEKTSTADIKSFTQAKLAGCATEPANEDLVEMTTTGGTSLRYDTTGHQFIQNWQTPKVTQDTYYRATVTFMDGSTLTAFFRLRK